MNSLERDEGEGKEIQLFILASKGEKKEEENSLIFPFMSAFKISRVFVSFLFFTCKHIFLFCFFLSEKSIFSFFCAYVSSTTNVNIDIIFEKIFPKDI